MFENIIKFFKKAKKDEKPSTNNSKTAAKERLHLVLMQDRANVSADFLDLMRQEIIDVIKKYIEVDESAIDVRLTNKENEDGTNGAPALYANIPIITIKNEARKMEKNDKKQEDNKEKQDSKVVEEEKNEESNNINSSLEKENDENKEEKEKNEEIAEVISEAEEIKDNNQEIIIEEAQASVENKEENKEAESSTADNN